MTTTDVAIRESTNGHVSRDWIELLEPAAALANQVAGTGFVPRAMQGNPAAIVAAILYGDELGLGPMQALAKIAVIEGKPTLSAEAQRALVLAAGHELWLEEATTTKVTVAGKRAGSDRTSSVTWTLDDAKRANLAGRTNWRTYPRQMLTARATAELCRVLFADVVGGLAATEELEDVDDLIAPIALLEATAATTPTTKRRRRKIAAQTPEAPSDAPPAEPGGPDGEDAGTTAPALPPLPDEPAETLLEPTTEPVDPPAGVDPEDARGDSPAETGSEHSEQSEPAPADGIDFGESTGGTSPADDTGEATQDDETTASSEPAVPAGASPVNEPPATASQRKKLDGLVGRLRETEVELEDGSKTTVLSVEQLWPAAATRRNVEVDVMIELLGGRDEAGVLHWSPLRDSLTKSEASDLIAKLEDRAEKWGVS